MPPNTAAAGQREFTFGEKAVGLSFNPSGDPEVQEVKVKCAALIDMLHDLKAIEKGSRYISDQKQRMLSEAITCIQTGQMWAVKAITWKD